MNKAINIVCVCVCLICAIATIFSLKELSECKSDISDLYRIAEAQLRINEVFKDSLFK
jgi:hypothetical protein